MTRVTQTWWIKSVSTSKKKYCSRCGAKTDFVSSRKFRCNSNGKSIDVWLIYNCVRCKNSWNMPVEERRRVSSIPSTRLQQYYANDAELADQVGEGDSSTDYTVTKRVHCDCQPARIRIVLSGSGKLRADRFLAKELGLSRSALDKTIKSGRIRSLGSDHRAWKRPLRYGQIIEIDGDCHA